MNDLNDYSHSKENAIFFFIFLYRLGNKVHLTFCESLVLKMEHGTEREGKGENEWKEKRAWCQLSDLRPAEADLWEVTATALPVRIPPVIGSERVEHTQARTFPLSSGSELWPSGAKHSILAALSPESPLLPAAYLDWMQPTVLCLFSSGAALHHSQNDFFPFCWTAWSLRSVCCATHHVPYTKSPEIQKPTRRNEDDYTPVS